MVPRHVSLESSFFFETCSTNFTFEWPVFNVDYFVRIEISHLGEAFAALVAPVRFLSRVGETMSSEIEASVEHFRAPIALEPPVIVVNPNMSAEIAPNREGSITHCTFEGALAGVRSHVDFEIRAVRECLHTKLTQ